MLAAVQDASRRLRRCRKCGILDGVCARRSAGRQVGRRDGVPVEQGMSLDRSCSSNHVRVFVIRDEQGLPLEQLAKHIEQSITDTA